MIPPVFRPPGMVTDYTARTILIVLQCLVLTGGGRLLPLTRATDALDGNYLAPRPRVLDGGAAFRPHGCHAYLFCYPLVLYAPASGRRGSSYCATPRSLPWAFWLIV